MPDHDDGAAPTRPPQLSRRTLLGALALAPALPWLAPAARAANSPPASLAYLTPLPRQQHTATPLPDGSVLLAGGLSQGLLADVEILGPGGRRRAAPSLNTPRYGHAAVCLAGGQVVVLGGYGQGPLADVEMYDPESEQWTTLAPLALPRYQHAASLLPGGQILLTGGVFQGILSDTELYGVSSPTSWPPKEAHHASRSVHLDH